MTAPRFSDGDLLSASGHINDMTRIIDGLFNAWYHPQQLNNIGMWGDGHHGYGESGGYDVAIDGFFRYKIVAGYVFSYDILVEPDQAVEAEIYIDIGDGEITDTLTIASGQSVAYHLSGTIALPQPPTSDYFYSNRFVHVQAKVRTNDGSGWEPEPHNMKLTFYRFGQSYAFSSSDPSSFSALTADQILTNLQTLSTRLDELILFHSLPVSPCHSRENDYFRGANTKIRGTMVHKNGILIGHVRMRAPFYGTQWRYDKDGNQIPGTEKRRYGSLAVFMSVNGSIVKTRAFSCIDGDFGGSSPSTTVSFMRNDWFEEDEIIATQWGEWILLGPFVEGTGFINCTRNYLNHNPSKTELSTRNWVRHADVVPFDRQVLPEENVFWEYRLTAELPVGVNDGDDYYVEFDHEFDDHGTGGDTVHGVKFMFCFEQPKMQVQPSGWTSPILVDHKDTVDINDLETIRLNAQWLFDNLEWINQVSVLSRKTIFITTPLLMVGSARKYDYLHVMCNEFGDDDDDPVLHYWNGKEWQNQSINIEAGEWEQIDLNDIDGFFVGNLYFVVGADYVIEDNEPL